MRNLPVLKQPDGYRFSFYVGGNILRILNEDFPHQPWDIEVEGTIPQGGGLIRVSSHEITVRLHAREKGKLDIVITGMVHDEQLMWQVPLDLFNKGLAISAYAIAYEQALEAGGLRCVDEGPE